MQQVKSLFTSPTAIGTKVEGACSELLLGPDWGQNVEICDLINQLDSGPKDAIKAIKKRMTSKNPKVAILALTLLETCVKNCGLRFHVLVASKDFMNELVKLAETKKHKDVEEKALQLIQALGEAFESMKDQQNLSTFWETYQLLRRRGVSFPARDVDSISPIFTPPAGSISNPPAAPVRAGDAFSSQTRQDLWQPSNAQSNVNWQPAPVQPPPAFSSAYQPRVGANEFVPELQRDPAPTSVGQQLRPAQVDRTKLATDLAVVRSNVDLLLEVVNATDPDKENISDNALAVELHDTCKQMHQRVLSLIEELGGSSSPEDEIMLADLLSINDDVQRAFKQYDQVKSLHRAPAVPSEPEWTDSLIDLNTSSKTPASTQGIDSAMVNLNITSNPPENQDEEEEQSELELRGRARTTHNVKSSTAGFAPEWTTSTADSALSAPTYLPPAAQSAQDTAYELEAQQWTQQVVANAQQAAADDQQVQSHYFTDPNDPNHYYTADGQHYYYNPEDGQWYDYTAHHAAAAAAASAAGDEFSIEPADGTRADSHVAGPSAVVEEPATSAAAKVVQHGATSHLLLQDTISKTGSTDDFDAFLSQKPAQSIDPAEASTLDEFEQFLNLKPTAAPSAAETK